MASVMLVEKSAGRGDMADDTRAWLLIQEVL